MTNKEKATQHIKLYSGPEHPCGYLKDQTSTSMFVDPTMPMDNYLYSQLSRLGFRRSGSHIYRPKCPNCSACWTYRVLANQFKASKTQRRILKANQSLTVSLEPAKISATDYELYEKYINIRHKDGEMYPPYFQQYEEFLFSDWCESAFIRIQDQQKTIAIMCLDLLDDGFSAVYSFFDPESSFKSLGVYLILETISLCQRQGLPYAYLGYHIENCNKMNYKRQYQPAEVFQNNRWKIIKKE